MKMQTQKKSNVLKLSFLLITICLALTFLSAATTINAPANNAVISCGGNTLFNVTITDGDVIGREDVNLSFYFKSSLSGNTTWALVGTNNSVNLTAMSNITLTNLNLTGLIEDANDYILNVTVNNGTDGVLLGSDTNTGITFDCTVPATPAISSHTNNQLITTDGTQTFSYTVTDSQTTACTYTIYRYNSPSDGVSGSGTYSGSTCSFTKAFTGTKDLGDWYVTATASDGTNSTASTTTIVLFQPAATGGSTAISAQSAVAVNQLSLMQKLSNFFSDIWNFITSFFK